MDTPPPTHRTPATHDGAGNAKDTALHRKIEGLMRAKQAGDETAAQRVEQLANDSRVRKIIEGTYWRKAPEPKAPDKEPAPQPQPQKREGP